MMGYSTVSLELGDVADGSPLPGPSCISGSKNLAAAHTPCLR